MILLQRNVKKNKINDVRSLQIIFFLQNFTEFGIILNQRLHLNEIYKFQKQKMDMEQPIKFEGEFFGHETDSDLCQRISGQFTDNFSLWDDQINEKIEEQKLIDSLIYELETQIKVIDTPLTELIALVQSRHYLDPNQRSELIKILRRKKLTQKRMRAKRRQKIEHIKLPLMFKSSLAPSVDSQEETKKQKNRLSAQISRDKKKQYSRKLEEENRLLTQKTSNLQMQNKRLKDELQKARNQQSFSKSLSPFVTFLITLGLFFFINILKDNASNKSKKSFEESIPLVNVQFTKQEQKIVQARVKQNGFNLGKDFFGFSHARSKNLLIPKNLAESIDLIKRQYLQ